MVFAMIVMWMTMAGEPREQVLGEFNTMDECNAKREFVISNVASKGLPEDVRSAEFKCVKQDAMKHEGSHL